MDVRSSACMALIILFFFFNDTATTEIYTLSLHDALPISLFTDFTAVNTGVPRSHALRFYCENTPNAAGYAPNPAGASYADGGVGGFLRSTGNPNRGWARLATSLDGAMRVPTLRNVDKRPQPDFVKAYMHNGYFKSLKEVGHFYNTRDTLPRCEAGSQGEKVSCWPPPESATNINTNCCDLGLSDDQEDDVVAFLK